MYFYFWFCILLATNQGVGIGTIGVGYSIPMNWMCNSSLASYTNTYTLIIKLVIIAILIILIVIIVIIVIMSAIACKNRGEPLLGCDSFWLQSLVEEVLVLNSIK